MKIRLKFKHRSFDPFKYVLTDSALLKSAKNRFLALVGGKIGSNEKTQKIKCFSIISRNINPDAQPEIPKFTFYHPLLIQNKDSKTEKLLLSPRLN